MSTAVESFKNKLLRLSEIGHRQGFAHLYSGGTGHFDTLSEQAKLLAITGLDRYVGLLQDLELKGPDFSNTNSLLAAALKKLNLTLPVGLLEKILPTDFVEIYSPDLVAIFKSVNFWGLSSYELDELYSCPYDDLYERSEFYQASLNRAAIKIFTGQESVIEKPVPEHVTYERRGPKSCKISYKYLAAVFDDNGSIAAGICVSHLQPLPL